MRLIRPVSIVTALLAALFVSASLARAADEPAPPRRGGFGQFGGDQGGPLRILRNEKAQKELELTDDQKDAIKKAGEELANSASGFRDLSPEERRAKMEELRPKLKELGEKIKASLTTKQRDRLKQLEIQIRGADALTESDTAEALKLTDEQKSKLKDLVEERRKAVADLRPARGAGNGGGGGNFREAMEKIRKARKESDEKMLAVLTTEQKEQFEKMQGSKVDLDEGQPGGGPRRRGNQ